jgi:hypothetical protein
MKPTKQQIEAACDGLFAAGVEATGRAQSCYKSWRDSKDKKSWLAIGKWHCEQLAQAKQDSAQ